MTKASSIPRQQISPDDLRCFDDLGAALPLRVDLVYARPDHKDNIFKTALYKPAAKLWCHRDLFDITIAAAQICYAETGYLFEIKDSLRVCEAQEKMQQTDIVKANPHWCDAPDRLLSPPGMGGHPRGMAIDIILIDANGDEIDMGTRFDYFTTDPACNPAARDYTDFHPDILNNRQILERAMLRAAKHAGHALLPLPQEWWDFRFMPDYSNQFAPLYDADLPEDKKMLFLA
ncbi:MAG: M15 family metallopeptidase [Pseudomonadota bacterium]